MRRLLLLAIMAVIIVCPLFLAFANEPAIPKSAKGTKRFEISRIRHLDTSGLPYVYVSFHVPKPWGNPAFKVTVNGLEVPYKKLGWGDIEGWPETTFLLFPGEPGPKEVAVYVNSKGVNYEARRKFEWNPPAMSGLLDSPGNSELLSKPRKIRFWTFRGETVRAVVNDVEIRCEKVSAPRPQLDIFVIDPQWKAGRNTLSIVVVPKEKNAVQLRQEFSFVNITAGPIAQNEIMKLSYGQTESRSGTSPKLFIQGDAIRLKGQGEERYYLLDESGWPYEDKMLTERLVAEKEGEAKVKLVGSDGKATEFSVKVLPVN